MALPSTGPLSFSQIQGEFGGANPISLTEYYGAASGIPASGTISVSDFRGKSAYINISNVSASLNPSYNQASSPSFTTVSTSSTASASNGTGSYSYSWTYVSGTTSNVSTSGTNTATMTFSRPVPPGGPFGSYYSAVWRCTVSDGTSSGSIDVTFGVRNTYSTGGGFEPLTDYFTYLRPQGIILLLV